MLPAGFKPTILADRAAAGTGTLLTVKVKVKVNVKVNVKNPITGPDRP
jgi:hypothetical protein